MFCSVHFYTANSEKGYTVNWCVTVFEGHSRLSKSVQIESPFAISYQTSFATVYLHVMCLFRLLYAAETCTMKAADMRQRLAYEMRCYRKIVKVALERQYYQQ